LWTTLVFRIVRIVRINFNDLRLLLVFTLPLVLILALIFALIFTLISVLVVPAVFSYMRELSTMKARFILLTPGSISFRIRLVWFRRG